MWYTLMVQSALLKVAAEIGMDGLILPDVPFEEKEEFAIPFKEHGLGSHLLDRTDFPRENCHDRKRSRRFGISEPKQAKKMAAQSDGVIVGSAIVKLCENMEQIVSHTFPHL